MKAKKIISAILCGCALMGTAATASCGGGEYSVPPASDADYSYEGTIEFMGWGGTVEKSVMTKLIAGFRSHYPKVKVVYTHISSGATELLNKLNSRIAAGTCPDVFYMTSSSFHAYANGKNLANLTPYIASTQTFDMDDVNPQILDFYRYDGYTDTLGTGDLYGLPKDFGPWAMCYNKDIFDAYNAAHPDAPVEYPDPDVALSWTEFAELAQKLTAGSGANKTFGCSNYQLEAAIYSNGGSVLKEDNKSLNLNDPKVAEAMQYVADLANVYHCSPDVGESSAQGWYQRWINGKIAMAWCGPWDVGTFWDICDFEWDLMPTPVPDDVKEEWLAGNPGEDDVLMGCSWLDSAAICVSPDSKNREIAYKFAEYICFSENAAKQSVELGLAIPNSISAQNEIYLADTKRAPAHKEIFLRVYNSREYGRFKANYYSYDTRWYNAITDNAGAVYNGTKTAASYLSDPQTLAAIQALLDDGNANLQLWKKE